jgi:hypothetical protein
MNKLLEDDDDVPDQSNYYQSPERDVSMLNASNIGS